MINGFIKRNWFEILLISVVMGVHVYAAASRAQNFPTNWFSRDDAYYYFKVAQNLTEGHGFTFDGINPSNGYHPLWMLVNIPIFALARYDLILPLRVLLILQGALSVGTALLIHRIISATLSRYLAVLAACWWAFDLTIHGIMYEYGLETGLASFSVALLIHWLYRFEQTWREVPPSIRQVAGLAFFALMALFSRLDLIFLAVLAGPWIILRGTRLRILLPFDLLLAALSILAAFTFRLGVRDYYLYSQTAMVFIGISVTSRAILYFFLGLYQDPRERRLPWILGRIALTVTAGSVISGLVMLAAAPLVGSFPRSVIMYDWLFNLAGMILLRALAQAFSLNSGKTSASPVLMLKDKGLAWVKEGFAYFSVLGIPLGLYMLFNQVTFGIAMPVSGQIKRWWGSNSMRAYGGPARDPLAFWGVDLEAEYNAWMPLTGWINRLSAKVADWAQFYRNDETYTALLTLTGVILVFIFLLDRHRAVRVTMQSSLPLLLVSSILQVMSYNTTGYSAVKEWYWISQPILLVFVLCLALSILIQPIQKLAAGRAVFGILVAALSLSLAWNFSTQVSLRMPHGAIDPEQPYLDSVKFLEERTPPGAMIGMTGGGNVGYYIKDRTIVNLDGLINSPAYFEALKTQTATPYLEGMGLDYIFANPYILKGKPYRGQYALGMEIDRFGGKVLMEFNP